MNGASKYIPQVPVVPDALWAWREAMRVYLLSMQAVHGQVTVLFRVLLDAPEFAQIWERLDWEQRDAIAFLRSDTQAASQAWAGVEAAKGRLP